MIAGAIELFDHLSIHSNKVDVKKKAFLCITCSGVLLLCLDVTLKAIEEWSICLSAGIVKSAGHQLTLENLEGALGVTSDSWEHCDE